MYAFIGCRQSLSEGSFSDLLKSFTPEKEKWERITDILLYYGVFGVMKLDGDAVFIYDVNYDMKLLKGLLGRMRQTGLVYQINPAFEFGLGISLQ